MMELLVISPDGVQCSARTSSVSFPGAAGRFTVLKDHAPLVSSLVAGEIVYKADDGVHTLQVCGGFVRVSHNRIEVTAETEKAER